MMDMLTCRSIPPRFQRVLRIWVVSPVLGAVLSSTGLVGVGPQRTTVLPFGLG